MLRRPLAVPTAVLGNGAEAAVAAFLRPHQTMEFSKLEGLGETSNRYWQVCSNSALNNEGPGIAAGP